MNRYCALLVVKSIHGTQHEFTRSNIKNDVKMALTRVRGVKRNSYIEFIIPHRERFILQIFNGY